MPSLLSNYAADLQDVWPSRAVARRLGRRPLALALSPRWGGESYRAGPLLFAVSTIATTRSWSSPFGTSLRKLSHAFTAPA
jgi:hypothetical protein